jgi:hypothetical protein
VPAAGAAAIAPLEVVGCGEDQVWAFVVEVSWVKFFAWGVHLLFFGWVGVEIGWLRHGFIVFSLFYSFCKLGVFAGGYPPLPARKGIVFIDLRDVMVCKNFMTKGLRPNMSKQMS